MEVIFFVMAGLRALFPTQRLSAWYCPKLEIPVALALLACFAPVATHVTFLCSLTCLGTYMDSGIVTAE